MNKVQNFFSHIDLVTRKVGAPKKEKKELKSEILENPEKISNFHKKLTFCSLQHNHSKIVQDNNILFDHNKMNFLHKIHILHQRRISKRQRQNTKIDSASKVNKPKVSLFYALSWHTV